VQGGGKQGGSKGTGSLSGNIPVVLFSLSKKGRTPKRAV